MRRPLSLVLALVAGFFVLGVPSAVAGGPTSVLLANYETGRDAEDGEARDQGQGEWQEPTHVVPPW